MEYNDVTFWNHPPLNEWKLLLYINDLFLIVSRTKMI